MVWGQCRAGFRWCCSVNPTAWSRSNKPLPIPPHVATPWKPWPWWAPVALAKMRSWLPRSTIRRPTCAGAGSRWRPPLIDVRARVPTPPLCAPLWPTNPLPCAARSCGSAAASMPPLPPAFCRWLSPTRTPRSAGRRRRRCSIWPRARQRQRPMRYAWRCGARTEWPGGPRWGCSTRSQCEPRARPRQFWPRLRRMKVRPKRRASPRCRFSAVPTPFPTICAPCWRRR